MEQVSLGKEKAIELYDNEFWKSMSYRERAEFQMFTKEMCMPFGIFHEAMEKSLGRGVYTHEFGFNWEGLAKELKGEADSPTLKEIIELIPEEKRVLVVVTDGQEGKD